MEKHEHRQGETQTRKELWVEEADLIQADINEFFENMQPEIDDANRHLRDLDQADPDQAAQFAKAFLRYLNSEWKDAGKGDVFMVSGVWHQASLRVNEHGCYVDHAKTEVVTSAKADNFIVKRIVENPESDDTEDEAAGTPRIGLSFDSGKFKTNSSFLKSKVKVRSFADLKDISLQYLRPGTEEIVSSNPQEICDAIVRADNLLKICSSDLAFFRQNGKQQQCLIDEIIDGVEKTLPTPSSYDSAYLDKAQFTALYMNVNNQPVVAHTGGQANTFYEVSGRIMGATIPDMFCKNYRLRIKSPDQFLAGKSGICLIVQPSQLNFKVPDGFSDLLLVPYRAAVSQLSIFVR